MLTEDTDLLLHWGPGVSGSGRLPHSVPGMAELLTLGPLSHKWQCSSASSKCTVCMQPQYNSPDDRVNYEHSCVHPSAMEQALIHRLTCCQVAARDVHAAWAWLRYAWGRLYPLAACNLGQTHCAAQC